MSMLASTISFPILPVGVSSKKTNIIYNINNKKMYIIFDTYKIASSFLWYENVVMLP